MLRDHHVTHLVLQLFHIAAGLVCITSAIPSHVSLTPHIIRLDIVEGKFILKLLLACLRIVQLSIFHDHLGYNIRNCILLADDMHLIIFLVRCEDSFSDSTLYQGPRDRLSHRSLPVLVIFVRLRTRQVTNNLLRIIFTGLPGRLRSLLLSFTSTTKGI